jgi:hypothetical protein
MSNTSDCSDDETTTVSFVPAPYITQYIDQRPCSRRNYIPHRTPSNANRHEWHNAYYFQLIEMYKIIENILNQHYPKVKINWSSNKIFNNFSRLIFNCSSKYISKDISKFKELEEYIENDESREEK